MSSLKERLANIRGKGKVPDIIPVADVPSLAQRLKRLRPDPAVVQPTLRPDDEELARFLGGRVEKPGLIVVQRTLKQGFRYGRYPLAHHSTRLSEPLLTDREVRLDESLFLDTETTGLSGGAGTVAFMVGLGETGADGFRVTVLLITGFSGERGMLETLAGFTSGRRHVVSYNGKTFDLPLLANRYRIHGMGNPLENCHSLDLLHPVRRAFRRQWPDCQLGSVEARLLGRPRKNDIPGQEIPSVWTGFVQHGQTRRLSEVVRHNAMDILAMAALLPALDQVYRFPGAHHADISALARAMMRTGHSGRAMQLLQGSRTDLDDAGRMALATLYRNSGDWQQALGLWSGLATKGHVQAIEALCKYYEHQGKDFAKASECTRQLLAIDGPLPTHVRRLQRLQRKHTTTDQGK